MLDANTARTPGEIKLYGEQLFAEFDLTCADIYPGQYTRQRCQEVAEIITETRRIATEKEAMIVAHSYQEPALHKVADFVGDSYGLAKKVLDVSPKFLHFSAVHFMGETAACLLRGKTQVMVQGSPEVHSCSLVEGTDYAWVEEWIREHPTGVLVTYINSAIRLKAMSHYICTSGNAAEVIARAHKEHPGCKILLLPDKYLGYVMMLKAHQKYQVPTECIEIYEKSHVTMFKGKLTMWHADCMVHRGIGDNAPEEALDMYPGAILMLHPECGCANSCMLKLAQGKLPKDRVIHASTEGMLHFVRSSSAKEFIVGTEIGMIYRLRQLCPDRTFIPIAGTKTKCPFMAENTPERLLASVRGDRYKLVFRDDVAVGDDRIIGDEIRINSAAADKAMASINNMITTAPAPASAAP